MKTQSGSYKLTGFSTALFSTWYFVDELGVLFDCGDGLTSGLMQKAGKIRHVFISHSDRDHLAGLLQFNQLNARPGLRIYYPKDCGSFPALDEFCAKFDPMDRCTWIGIEPDEEVRIREDLVIRAIKNRHVVSKPGVKSLTYIVEQMTRKLKPTYRDLAGEEIAIIRQNEGVEAITDERRVTKLIYSGDTPIEYDGRYDGTEILIHEATFLTESELDSKNPNRNPHSSLDQVMRMVAKASIGCLVLGHFSSRYCHEQIDNAIRAEIAKHEITIPVYRVLPGVIARDILSSQRIN